jgi:serine/threonine-protein kinase
VYSLSVVLWELIVGHRLHSNGQAEAELVAEIMLGKLPTITQALIAEREMMGGYRWNQILTLEPIIQKGLATRVEDRWQSAAEMEEALAEALPPASPADVAAWLKALGKDFLEGREKMIAAEEQSWRRSSMSIVSSRPSSQPGQISRPGMLSGSMIALKKRSTKLAMAAGFAVLFGILVAFAVRGGGSSQIAAAHPTEAAPVQQPAVATPVAPPPVPITHDATIAREPEPAAAKDDTDNPKAAPAPRPRIVRVVQKQAPAPRREPPPPPPRPAVKQQPDPPVAKVAPATAKDDCNPPYYFEGRKKIFKPACL